MNFKEIFSFFYGEDMEAISFAIENKRVFIIIGIILGIKYLYFVFMRGKIKLGKLIKTRKNKDGSISYYLPPIQQISIKVLFIIIFVLIIFFTGAFIYSNREITQNELLYSFLFLTIIALFLYRISENNNKLYAISNGNKHDQVIFYKDYFIYVSYMTQYKHKVYYKDIDKIEFIKKFNNHYKYNTISSNVSVIIVDFEKVQIKKMSRFALSKEYPPFIFYGGLELQDKFRKISRNNIETETIESKKYNDYNVKKIGNLYGSFSEKIKNYINKSK